MPLGYVLTQAGYKMGLDKNQPSSRQVLLRFANEAAEELYDSFDPSGSLLEEAFKINGNQTISVPYYVGEIRAAREMASQVNWKINQLRPRYNQFNWPDGWRNLRLKNTQALMATVTNQSVGVITVAQVESPPITITLAGPTEIASNATEDVVMDELSKRTVHQYLDYTLVSKNRVNDCNVILSDVDGKLLTVVPNNMLLAVYQVYDISQCPWIQNSGGSQDHYMEILFKKALPWFENDSDEFPAQKYDNVWVNKILQLWAEEQEKPEAAIMWDGKATRSAARKKDNRNESTEDTVAVVANPHDTLLPRVRSGRGRYRYYRGRW